MQKRTYLTITKRDKKRAIRAAGRLPNGDYALQYDEVEKLWFAVSEADLERVNIWLPENTVTNLNPPIVSSNLTPEEEFARVLQDKGFILPGDGLPEMDGKRHRVATKEDKAGATSGVYQGFTDGRPAGWYQDHRSSEGKINWTSTGTYTYDPINTIKQRALAAQKRWDREIQSQAVYARWGKILTRQWNKMPPAPDSHPYLSQKGVPATEGVRLDKYNNLVIPLRNVKGDIRTLQYIKPDGSKNLKKYAEKSGNYFVVGGSLNADQPFLYAEGYATAASLNMASGLPVIMTVDAGNMVTVSQTLMGQYPDAMHIILGEDDFTKNDNKGHNKAQEAAKNISGICLIPQFTDHERTQALAGIASFSDFNDIHVSRGLDAVRDQLATVLDPVVPGWRQPFTDGNADIFTSSPAPSGTDVAPTQHSVLSQETPEEIMPISESLSSVTASESILTEPNDHVPSPVSGEQTQEPAAMTDEVNAEIPADTSSLSTDILSDMNNTADNQAYHDTPLAAPVDMERPSADSIQEPDKTPESQHTDIRVSQVTDYPSESTPSPERLLQATAEISADISSLPTETLSDMNNPSDNQAYHDTPLAVPADSVLSPADSTQKPDKTPESKHLDIRIPSVADHFSESTLSSEELPQATTEIPADISSLPTETLSDMNNLTDDQAYHDTPLAVPADTVLSHADSTQEPDKTPESQHTDTYVPPVADHPSDSTPSPEGLPQATAGSSEILPVQENGFSFSFGRLADDISPEESEVPRINLDELLQGLTSRREEKSWLYLLDGEEAFRDYGDRIVMATSQASDNDRMILAALLSAKANQRGAVEITGDNTFINRTLTLIADYNINVYLKNPQQREQFAALMKARTEQTAPQNGLNMHQADTNVASEMTHNTPGETPLTSNTSSLAPVTAEHATSVNPPMAAPVDVDNEHTSPAAIPELSIPERENLRTGLTGKLLAANKASYQFDENNKDSFYVQLRTKTGNKTFWGVELEQALADSGQQPGDMVKLQYTGKKPVTVTEPVKNKEGAITGYRQIETHRNQWAVKPATDNHLLIADNNSVAPAVLSAYDGNVFWQLQQQVVHAARLSIPLPAAVGHGLLYTAPDGEGHAAPETPPVNVPLPGYSKAAGSVVMQALDAEGKIMAHLVKSHGDYLQGVVRHEGQLHNVLARICIGNNGNTFLALNSVQENGTLQLIGHATAVNSHQNGVSRYDTFAFQMKGPDSLKFAVPLVAPGKIPPALHSKLGFVQRYTPPNADEPAQAPRTQVKPVQPQPM